MFRIDENTAALLSIFLVLGLIGMTFVGSIVLKLSKTGKGVKISNAKNLLEILFPNFWGYIFAITSILGILLLGFGMGTGVSAFWDTHGHSMKYVLIRSTICIFFGLLIMVINLRTLMKVGKPEKKRT